MTEDRLSRVIAAIDAANAADPERTDGRPAALLYGERMSAELVGLVPSAGEALRIAVRGQHIERWTSPRASYPAGREGYLAWRRDLAAYHARRLGEIMAHEGYGPETIAEVGRMVRKEGLKREPGVQALEDVACFTFLRWYLDPFAKGRDPAELDRIVAKTARKMSDGARARALATFALAAPLAAHFR